MSNPACIRTHMSTYGLTNQTKLKSILMDLIWLKVLRNSCTVPYLFLLALVFSFDCYIKRLETYR